MNINKKYLKYGIVVLAAVLIISIFNISSGSPKKVAMNFAQAMISDRDASKMISLMSEDLLDESMENTGATTKKVLIANFEERFKTIKDEPKAKLKYIDKEKIDSDTINVFIEAEFKVDSGIFGLSKEEKNEQITIGLVKENGKWRVSNFK